MRRHLLVPVDYRQPAVIGWVGPAGFEPDEPVDDRTGILLEVETTIHTPTAPPPPPQKEHT